ncbi:unnamed protein product [Prorocentrum cordatum]|uniref:Uncharacterized protein n=1 Tax=Prorocentrum cordatum TaxID=2364126 RepID=A0ABN9UKJ7_9DINO|nr:unnamed protein product [Polarella glacialis]
MRQHTGQSAAHLCASIGKLGKTSQWAAALASFRDGIQANIEADLILHNVIINACGKGRQWQQALMFLVELGRMRLEPDGWELERRRIRTTDLSEDENEKEQFSRWL